MPPASLRAGFHDGLRLLGSSLRWLLLGMVLYSTNVISAPRIASLDWTLAETLVAIDAPPVALAQTNDYTSWVGNHVPADIEDLGLRGQPNMELLASLQPDEIIISSMFSNLEPMLSEIAPVRTYSLYTPGTPVWPELESLTRQLGELSDHEQEAERLIADSNARMKQLAERIPADTRPLIALQFMDARHVRVFGADSLFEAVMERLGLRNGWQEPTNAWGFTLVGIEQLVSLEEARLVVVEPYPAGVAEALETSGLWQHLASVQRDDVIILPPVWSFGSLPSAIRFADTLVAALDTETPDAETLDAEAEAVEAEVVEAEVVEAEVVEAEAVDTGEVTDAGR
ncbi:iron-siderophore ABC transporter substrate-binding protein [Halomonas huangheensis]|uniref:Fe/B12 periplasmic-binding domain-containing protein n=1 Tax=Halomonas huangheensis TaxID=1178482 RepID=W1N8V3_9GAMM|nr:iron-siderophore ABC transporter substrate-binding protein [Halomonas huangheensis]ERL51914.1 hypothetical protein BJB45_12160 [Halomonas huangheensis]